MPRKCINKKVCRLPKCMVFSARTKEDTSEMVISVEEYEVIRLLDYQGFTQEEASKKMGVARTTLQALYDEARKNIAKAIVEGSNLVISGGNYYLCSGDEAECDCGGCEKHRKSVLNHLKNKIEQ